MQSESDVNIEDKLNSLKALYFDYIQNSYIHSDYTQHELNFIQNTDINILFQYISTHSDPRVENNSKNRRLFRNDIQMSNLPYYLREYLYFNTIPSLINNELLLDEAQFHLDYFIWRKEGDTAAITSPPRDIPLTVDNYGLYRTNSIQGWSKAQLKTFVQINIVDEILKRIGIKTKVSIRKRNLSSAWLNSWVIAYINNSNEFFEQNNLINLKSIIDKLRSLTTLDLSLFDVVGFQLLVSDPQFRDMPKHLKNMYGRIIIGFAKSLEKTRATWDKLRSSIYQNRDGITRFKWQALCKPSHFQKNFDINELRLLAADESIPQHLFLTKREICTELAERFERVLQGKNKVIDKCINTTSTTLTDLKDIPPEFFFSYIHNNKVFCDDLRDLYKHFQLNGAKHPIDRSVVPQSLIDQVNKWYAHLERSTITLEDLFVDSDISDKNMNGLSSKAADLANLLYYPKDISLFINSSQGAFDFFVIKLFQEGLITHQQDTFIAELVDLDMKKAALLDFLKLNIMNDPQTIPVENGRMLSSRAVNISNVWNDSF